MISYAAAWQSRLSRLLGLCLILLSLSLYPAPVLATSLPEGFTEALVAGGLVSPTAMAFAPDGRIFVAQQGGALRVIENGTLLTTPFVTLNVDPTLERGLLGVAFDPDFDNNHYVYVYYTTSTDPRHNRVSRFIADDNVAVPGSEEFIIDLDNLSGAANHNGGAIHFGPDGKLYVAVGDNATGSNSQTLTNRLGKILRYNANGSIPAGNPFYDDADGENRSIWALGLRNPFTFTFQPGTGRMFINDVGEGAWEEINDGIAGSNYGWPATEGETNNPDYRSPLYAYPHNGGTVNGRAITGGAFYNPATVMFPAIYVGSYFFADYSGDWIRRYEPAADMVHDFALSTANAPVDLKVAPDGSLYYLAGAGSGSGGVYRIIYTNFPVDCPDVTAPSPDGAAPIPNYFTESTPTLTWGRVTYAQGYEVQVDDQRNFNNPEFFDNTLSANELQIETPPLIDCTYYWRVRAKRGATSWGSWSSPQTFVINAEP